MLHNCATGLDGKLDLPNTGTSTGVDLAPKALHFAIGDVGGMVATIKELTTRSTATSISRCQSCHRSAGRQERWRG